MRDTTTSGTTTIFSRFSIISPGKLIRAMVWTLGSTVRRAAPTPTPKTTPTTVRIKRRFLLTHEQSWKEPVEDDWGTSTLLLLAAFPDEVDEEDDPSNGSVVFFVEATVFDICRDLTIFFFPFPFFDVIFCQDQFECPAGNW